MFCCSYGSLDREDFARPGETRTSLCLQCRVHVLTPIVGKVSGDRGACCRRTSSQLHQIVCVTGGYVLGSRSALAGNVPGIGYASPCWTSSSPLGHICLQVRGGTFLQAPTFRYCPWRYGILRHGCRCSSIVPSCLGIGRPFDCLDALLCGSSTCQS